MQVGETKLDENNRERLSKKTEKKQKVQNAMIFRQTIQECHLVLMSGSVQKSTLVCMSGIMNGLGQNRQLTGKQNIIPFWVP